MNNYTKKLTLQTVWLVGLSIIFIGWLAAHRSSLSSGELGLVLVSVGSLFGLVATYLFLTQFLLISGAKFIESRWGLDRLSGSHALNGKVGFGLLLVHPFLINLGRTMTSGEESLIQGYIEGYLDLVRSSWQMTLASIGLSLFFIIIFTSIVMVRKRLRYELWHFIHLATYLAVLLPAFHQLQRGQTLNGLAWFKYYWIGLFVFAFGTIIYFKFIRPLQLYLKHRFIVDEVVKEAEGVVSVYVTGKKLEEFTYEAGQFALWRFMNKQLGRERHPFTISSSPQDKRLRITVKDIGDFSHKIQTLEPGTPVVVDGPYGRFTSVVQTKKQRLFIAGGIGVTPLVSQLKSASSKNDTLIYGVRTSKDLALQKELSQTKANIIVVFSDEERKGAETGRVDEALLKKRVNDIKQHDVWLCGPPPMMDGVEKALLNLGVPTSQIHTERFRL